MAKQKTQPDLDAVALKTASQQASQLSRLLANAARSLELGRPDAARSMVARAVPLVYVLDHRAKAWE